MNSRVSFCLALLMMQATSYPKPQFPQLGLGSEWGSPAATSLGQSSSQTSGQTSSQGYQPSQELFSSYIKTPYSNPINILINCGGGDSGSAGGGGGGGCDIGEY